MIQSRFHIRIKTCGPAGIAASCDSGNGLGIVVGTPHKEDILTCGHAVEVTENGLSGFDEGRQELAKEMAKVYYTYQKVVGNTRVKEQCNLELANSNGWVRFFRTPY